MIARLRGKPVANTPDGLVVDVGGIGYLVAATPSAIRAADGADGGRTAHLPARARGRVAAVRVRGGGRA